MRTCLIFNPSARGEKARRFRDSIQAYGAGCALKPTSAPGEARFLAAEAVREGCETLVAVGGDGTVNEVLNGLAEVPGALGKVKLAVVPLGTVNVFAKELGLPATLSQAWRVVKEGRPLSIDLPYADYQLKGKPMRRFFAQLAGAGLDARAIELVNWPLKKKLGPLAYVYAGLQALTGPLSRIKVRGDSHEAEGQLVLIGNGRLYGGRYAIFPGADLTDGRLEVCVFPRVNWLTLARCGPALLVRGSLPAGVTQNFRAVRVNLRSETQAGIELDGELAGELPAHLGIHGERLTVLITGD